MTMNYTDAIREIRQDAEMLRDVARDTATDDRAAATGLLLTAEALAAAADRIQEARDRHSLESVLQQSRNRGRQRERA